MVRLRSEAASLLRQAAWQRIRHPLLSARVRVQILRRRRRVVGCQHRFHRDIRVVFLVAGSAPNRASACSEIHDVGTSASVRAGFDRGGSARTPEASGRGTRCGAVVGCASRPSRGWQVRRRRLARRVLAVDQFGLEQANPGLGERGANWRQRRPPSDCWRSLGCQDDSGRPLRRANARVSDGAPPGT